MHVLVAVVSLELRRYFTVVIAAVILRLPSEIGITNPILTVTKEIALSRSHLNRNILSRSHPKSYLANIEISVISRYHGNCCRENIKLPIKYYCYTRLSLNFRYYAMHVLVAVISLELRRYFTVVIGNS